MSTATADAPVRLPTRREVAAGDTWDLATLFADDAAWEGAFDRLAAMTDSYAAFKGTLASGPERLAACLDFDNEFEQLAEQVGTYASLRHCEDTADDRYVGFEARFLGLASKAAQAASYLRPEIMAISDTRMAEYLSHASLTKYRRVLDLVLRTKPHTLSEPEERLLAMQAEMAQAADQAFSQLTNADMKFGTVEVGPGKVIPLSHGSFSTCLHSPDRRVRQTAFHQYYAEFADHSRTLAATLASSIHKDIYYARARRHPSALEGSLFHDNVPTAVYDSLISAVRGALPALHRYYAIRKRAMGLDEIHHYDTYVPILSDLQTRHSWEEAVETVLTSLKPLGAEYNNALAAGLRGRWCDRYENAGKRSGAFSSGTYTSAPFILMNYQPEVLDHVFTLSHEAGHSMHTWYAAQAQPFWTYGYTIFVAEVASTFNEQFLSQHLLDNAKSDKERAYYINRELDAMRGTIFRQTMFAEFEKIIHAAAEKDEPLTLDVFRSVYRALLDAYFGPDFAVDDVLSLECLRIPHFYRAFYVYKYATGMSAAIALADRVSKGGRAELDAYLNFLRGGGSKDPLDLLRDAGVDMTTPTPVGQALKRFETLVDELDRLLA